MEGFQDFSKAPTIPEDANNLEYYRPNPAVYQRRLNENPYEVDVGFTAVDEPIYTNPKNYGSTSVIRANTAFYNRDQPNFTDNIQNFASSETRPKKPFRNVGLN